MNVIEIITKAEAAGLAACRACVPVPMVVSTDPMFSAAKPKFDYVTEGPCGFAWIKFYAKSAVNKEFLKEIKKAGYCEVPGDRRPSTSAFSKAYGGGYDRWVFDGGQSIARKEAYAEAYAKVLQSYGIECDAQSRMD